jgi:hypothetical protein
MKNGALVIVIILGAFGNAFHHPAFAQNAVGGPTKQSAVGGPVKQNAVGGPVKQNSPVVHPTTGGSISVSTPPHLNCPAGLCGAKGTKR